MKKNKSDSIRIRTISIKNYKGIDSFSMDFPLPKLDDEPDILVMGSVNGLGKTSIIECSALLLMCLGVEENSYKLRGRFPSINISDLLIRAGKEVAEIKGEVVIGNRPVKIELVVNRNNEIIISSDTKKVDLSDKSNINVNELVKEICGFASNPVIQYPFLLFHSYRKVQEGNTEMGSLVDDTQETRRLLRPPYFERPLSILKLLILRAMMDKAGLFELTKEKEPEGIIDKLNELIELYAGGSIHKLKPLPDNTFSFRVTPVNRHESFPFDGLSSGQKEIISTLFLVWYRTKNKPSVVFIDEPELHLNAQWHRNFVNKLIKIAPQNQYIVATHSEEVMDSVFKDRRILLYSEKVNDNG